jgi:hypothetical protein
MCPCFLATEFALDDGAAQARQLRMIASNIVFTVIGADQHLDGTGSVRPQGRVARAWREPAERSDAARMK